MNSTSIALIFVLVLPAASSAAAAAEQYEPATLSAAAVLQKADDARGGLSPGAYVEVVQSHGGGMDTLATTHYDGDDYVEYDKTGPFATAFGSYRGQHWNEDANGIVVLEAQFHRKVDPNVLAWEHPENPAYNVRALGMTSTQPQEYVLEANPPGGSDEYRYYDAKTFLLDRVVRYEKDRYRHVTTYGEYRTVFGQTRWFRRTYSDGRPQNDETARVLSFAPERPGAVSLAIPQSHPLFAVGAQPVPIPVRLTPDGFVARVTIAGRGLDLLVDSGASDIFLDPGVAHDLGIQPYGRTTQTIGGDIDDSLAMVPQMSVGPFDMRNVAVELSPVDQHLQNTRVVGLLGFDFLANAIPCFDMHDSSLVLYSQAGFAARKPQFAAMPMMVDDSVPRVPASFENTQGWFLLDTGAFETILYQNYVRKLPNAHVTQSSIGGFEAVGGAVSSTAYAVNDFAFGPVLFRNAIVSVPNVSTFDMTDYDGIIGRDALSVYEFCLDYAGRQAFLEAHKP